ncbi:MAG: hypothetical protein SWK76_02270 [Actinomycetota bacterium]|nr:hypothetical protein [Actinomycetota bacterium]
MRESVKNYLKMFGHDEKGKFIHEYIYRLGRMANLVEKKPPGKLPVELKGIVKVLVSQVAREMLSPETDSYHGKIMKLEHALGLVNVKENVSLERTEHVIP